MIKFTIVDNNENSEKYILKDSIIELDKDNEKITWKLHLKEGVITYVIKADRREPDILLIEQFISKTREHTFVISEYLVREYIYVEIGSERRQFTAHKE